MIFKQSILGISDAISQIQKIRVAEGLNGLFDATTVQQYTLAISGLNKQEAITLLQRQGLSTAQQAQILSSAGLLQTIQMLNASMIEEAVLNSEISGEKAEQVLTELGLIEAKTGNLIVTKECTVAEVAQALATKGIVGADAEAILSQLGLATANTTTTVSFAGLTTAIKANTIAMAKWLVTNPVGWCILAVGAIYGLTKAYDALTVSEEEMAEAHEESIQKAKDSVSEYEELKQELETIQQTYDDNEQKLKDLYKLRENQTITQAEQDYLEELEGQNEKLRQQIEYKQTLADIEAQEAEDDAVKALNEKTQDDSLTGRSTNGGATVEFDKITDAEKIKQNTGTINALTTDLTAYEKVIKGINLSQEEVDKYTQQLVGYQEQLNAVEGESDYANSQREFYQGKIDEIQGLLNGTLTYEQYEKAVSEATNSIQSLVTENDTLLQKVEPLNDAIKSTSGNNYELKKSNDEIIANAKDAAIGFSNYTDSLNNTSNALNEVQQSSNETDIPIEDISSQVSSLTSSYELLNTALSEQNENGTITSETLAKLQESYGNISDAIEITSNGIILNTNKLSELNKTQKESIKSGLADAEEELTKRFNENSVELAYYNTLLENNNGLTEYNGQNLEELIAAKQADQDATEGQIAELRYLQLEYENATSKHNAFIQSLSSKDSGSMYDDVVSGLEQVQKEWDSGNYGKDEIRNFVDYMSYEDMSTASIEEIKNAYQSAKDEANKYFTETVEGQQNFLNLLKETEVNGKSLASVDADGNWTITIDDMDEAAKACGKSVDFLQDCLNKLKDKGFEIEFTNEDNLVDVQANLDAINERIAEIKAQINAGDGSPQLKEELAELEDSKIEIEVAVNKQKAIEEIQSLQAQIADATPDVQAQLKQKQAEIANTYNIDLQSVLTMDTTSADNEVDGLTEKVENLDLSTTIDVDANTSLAKSAIDSVTNKTYTAKISLEVNGTKFSSQLKKIIEKSAKQTGDTESSGSGAGAYGTANISSGSYANGNIGLNKDQKNVMVSEIQPEMVVDPHNGKYTIYKHPTMLSKLPKDAIVFNGKQTEEILKNGMTTSFGKAYANGNITGSAYQTGFNGSGNLPSNSPSSKTGKSNGKSNNKNNNNDKDKSKSKTEIDWIARKLERLQKVIDMTKAKFENLFDLKSKSSNLDKQIEQTTKLQKANDKAVKKYEEKAKKYAKSSGLDKSLQKAVQSGRLDGYSLKDLIKKYGEKTAEKINKYKGYWDQAQEAKQQVEELTTTLRDLQEEQLQLYVDEAEAQIDLIDATNEVTADYKQQNINLDEKKKYLEISYQKQIEIADLTKNETEKLRLQKELQKELADIEKERFDNISEYYSNVIDMLDLSKQKIEDRISLLETKGMTVNSKYYEAEIEYQKEIISQKNTEYQTLQSQLARMESNGLAGTDDWLKAVKDLSNVESDITNGYISIAEANNKITDVSMSVVNKVLDKVKGVSDDMEWVTGLMSEMDMFTESGAFTNEGLATLGSYVSGMNTSKYAAEYTDRLLSEAQKALDENKLEFEFDDQKFVYNSKEQFLDAFSELDKLNKEQITQHVNDSNKAIDMYIDKLNEETSALKELIEERKNALQAQRDLYNYQKSIKESTDNVASLEKQIAALSGNTSEEGMMQVQKLQKQLSDAQTDLKEKEDEQNLKVQQEMLDNLYDEYESLINAETKNRGALLEKVVNGVNASTTTISDTIKEYADKYNYTDPLDSIKSGLTTLTGSDSALESIKNSVYDLIQPESAIGKIPTVFDGINTTLGEIKDGITKILEKLGIKTDTQNGSNDGTPSSSNSNTGLSIATQAKEALNKIGILGDNNPISNIEDKLKTLGILDTTSKNKDESLTEKATNYIKAHANKTSKKRDKLSDISKAIYDLTGGKVLTTDERKELAKIVGVSYNGKEEDNKKSGALYKKLKSLKISGFKRGGIAQLIKGSGEDGITLARNGEGFIAPEHLQPIQDLVQITPQLSDILKPMVDLPKMPDIQPVNRNANNIVSIDNVTLPNVTNYDEFRTQMFRDMQKDRQFEKMIENMSIDKLDKGFNSHTKYKYKW